LLGEPLLALPFAAVLTRAATGAGASGVGEHTELRSGRFINISRRELQSGCRMAVQRMAIQGQFAVIRQRQYCVMGTFGQNR